MSEIFKAYDVRGIYGKDLTEKTVYEIGRALVDFLNCKKIIIGYDMRVSSEKLVRAFIEGANDQGSDVINIGLVSTDTVYFASGKLNLPAVMFTASHNPPEWNGIKFCRAGAVPINYDTGLKNIRMIIKKNKFKKISKKGKITQKDILKEYVKHVHSFVDIKKIKNLKIAVDAGNGMAGKIIPLAFKGLNIKISPLYFRLDGTFPNHLADPSKSENLKDLQKKVKKEKCDFGMAFDGDADRIFFVDEQGEIINSSLTSCLIIKRVLEQNPNENIIYNLVCSRIVPETIIKNNGLAVKDRVGHSYIKQTMRNVNAIFACEHSAHYYYKHNYSADSGIITALIMAEILSKSREKLSELLEEFKKYHKIEETNTKVEDKAKKLKEIEKIYKKKRGSKFNKLDGITFEFKEWWFNVRPSNTESLLRLNLEADSKKLMEEKKKELLKLIRG
ncbi:phosphomannomutase/phosphoglucomutase [Candidatus Woesearchaeota archaeon]|nr:phosphomannomutase/phosphoglucomutase [Candidatus Woesearchaeota archaeon]